MLKAGPNLLIREGLSQQRLGPASTHRKRGAMFYFGLGGNVISKPAVPLNQKNQPGRYHVSPMSAMRSINFCKIPVKRKTLNIVDVFVPCLLVVVMFHAYRLRFCRLFQPSRTVH